MKTVLNHVAILVESIELTLEKNLFSANFLGVIEEFLSEGTKELYIGLNHQMGRLLLMQANGAGPYQRALSKRGAGLHHIALDVLNIDDFVASLVGSGWLLHPKSLEFYKSHKQVYLNRPGIPGLIEVQERETLDESEYFIEEVKFPFRENRLLNSLGCDRLKNENEIELRIDDKPFKIKDLLS